MKTRKGLEWLERKIEVLRSFDGSLLNYVSSSKDLKETSVRLKTSPSTVLKLDSNENFFVDSDYLNMMLQKVVKDLDVRFYNPEVVVKLKEALGKYVGVSPECIVVSSGSEQLIDLIVELFLEKGDNVVSIVPSFFMYQKRVLLKHAKFFGIPLNRDLSLNKEAILKKTTPRTRLIFLCSPNNPTGNRFETSETEALADKTSAILVLDEAYAEFADCNAVSLAVEKRNIIALRTFSKAFGLAGMRFGYAVTHPDLALPLSSIIPYTVSTVTANFVLMLLASIDVVRKSVERTRMERERLMLELKSMKGIRVFDSEANFVTFRPRESADYIHQKLLERCILVKNLGTLPIIGHCLRVTVGLPKMNDYFLATLRQILEEK